jgi:hypothetical protein
MKDSSTPWPLPIAFAFLLFSTAYPILLLVGLPALICAIAFGVAKTRLLRTIQSQLRARGYPKITAQEARRLSVWETRRLALGVKRLPPREELAVTPSWGDETNALFRLLKILADQRKRQR